MNEKQAKTGMWIFLGLFVITAGYFGWYEPSTFYYDPTTGALLPAGTAANKPVLKA